jgi:hypothetical protein
MYGSNPYGTAPFGATRATGDDTSFPEPSPGGAVRLLLMGLRTLLLTTIGWLSA